MAMPAALSRCVRLRRRFTNRAQASSLETFNAHASISTSITRAFGSFGDWDTALKAAGFDPENMRNHTFWDKSRITKELKRLHNQRLPLYPQYVVKNHAALFSVALRQHGLWDKALLAAGITPVPSRNRSYLLRRLEEAMDSGEKVPDVLRSDID